jgi:hypothetical protein
VAPSEILSRFSGNSPNSRAANVNLFSLERTVVPMDARPVKNEAQAVNQWVNFMGKQNFNAVRAGSSPRCRAADVFSSAPNLGRYREYCNSDPAVPTSLLPPEERGLFTTGGISLRWRPTLQRRNPKGGRTCRWSFK